MKLSTTIHAFLPAFLLQTLAIVHKKIEILLKRRMGDEDWVLSWDHGDPDSSPPSTMEAQWIISATCSLHPIHLIGFLWDKMGESPRASGEKVANQIN